MRWFKSLVSGSAVVAVMASGVAIAGETKAEATLRPLQISLSCPAGAVQKMLPDAKYDVTRCMKGGLAHGPYVVFHKNGQLASEGQYVNGFREGKWRHYDEQGALIHEVSFAGGNYDGTRTEFHANGRKKLEENYVEGKRQGLVRQFDVQGDVLKVVEFKDNRIVATR